MKVFDLSWAADTGQPPIAAVNACALLARGVRASAWHESKSPPALPLQLSLARKLHF